MDAMNFTLLIANNEDGIDFVHFLSYPPELRIADRIDSFLKVKVTGR
jgi:hypothetical protein